MQKKKEDEENGRRVQKERGRRKKRRRRGGRRRAKEKEHYGVRGDSIAITLTHVECRTCRVDNYNSTSRSRGLMHFGREGWEDKGKGQAEERWFFFYGNDSG